MSINFTPTQQRPLTSATLVAVMIALLLTACQANRVSAPVTLPYPPHTNVTLPARAAFYYPWYPETWRVNGKHVVYHPALGYYDSDSSSVISTHIKALDYAKVNVAIASWWGQKTHNEQTRIPQLLAQTQRLGSPLKWALYYEKEGIGDPSVSELQADLKYLKQAYVGPSYAVVDGKPVIFVYNTDDTDCEVVRRWRAAAAAWYVVLKVLPGYRSCTAQPSSWHQYAPARAADRQAGFAYSISPGFWRADEAAPRLPRDLSRWRQNIREMIAAGDPWQLVTTFNEWGEGTAVEEANTWAGKHYGSYIDALANDGAEAVIPSPTPPETP